MNSEMKRLFELLEKIEPVRATEMASTFEGRMERYSWRSLKISMGLFLILLLLAAWKMWTGSLNSIFINIGVVVGILTSITALLSVLFQMLPVFVLLIIFKRDAMRRLMVEMEFDLSMAKELKKFQPEKLKIAQQILETKIARIQARLMFFLGGADKIAILSLAVMGWAAWNEFPKFTNHSEYNVLYMGVAFLGGLSIGGVMLNVVMHRYIYYVEIIKYTLSVDFSLVNPRGFSLAPAPIRQWKIKGRIASAFARVTK